jgi:glycosyltransferase involved in cell wall biosynthesis
VLNGAAHLPEALCALDEQTVPAHELVVVDGGSTDPTCAVVEEWRRHRVADSTIVTLLERPGSGVAEAHNQGIAATTGEVILFAAHDDTVDRAAVARHLSALRSHPEAGMSVGLVHFVGSGTESDAGVRTELVGTTRRARVLEAVAVRRTVIDRIGAFRTDLGPSADLEWIARLADADVGIAEVPEVVVRKRLHPASVTYRRPETRTEVVGALRATLLRRKLGT